MARLGQDASHENDTRLRRSGRAFLRPDHRAKPQFLAVVGVDLLDGAVSQTRLQVVLPDFRLMERVKEIFDPERMWNPGRFMGKL